MRTKSKAMQLYCRKIKRLLPCGGRHRRAILAGIQTGAEDYLAEHPDATLQQLEAKFGQVETVADSYVAAMEIPDIRKKLYANRKIFYAAVAVVLVILISWAWAVRHELHHSQTTRNGYATVEIDPLPNSVGNGGQSL